MKVFLAKYAGFCGGVQRAYNMVEERFSGNLVENRVFIWGGLAHNKTVVKKISDWGIVEIDSLDMLKEKDILIVTAHGMGKDFFESLDKIGVEVFDTTCPKVMNIHEIVNRYYNRGFGVIIFGDKNHKEVQGINGWCDRTARVISSFSEAESFVDDVIKTEGFKGKGFLLVSQTTQKMTDYNEVSFYLKEQMGLLGMDLRVEETICVATAQRQPEAFSLAKKSKAVLVIGGKNSANTKRLFEVSSEANKNVFWVESYDRNFLKKTLSKFEDIAVVSGASTPKKDIQEIVEFLETI